MQAGGEALRSCSGCTACCDGWLRMTIRGHEVGPGRPCPFSAGGCCSIYDERPQDPCRQFRCGWLVEGSPLPDWLRPDLAKLILLPNNFEWRGYPVHVAVAVGQAPTPQALEWVMAHCVATRHPLMYQSGDDWIAYGPGAFQHDMRARLAAGNLPWSPAF